MVEQSDLLDICIAHEVGHYLGLNHSELPRNLMLEYAAPENASLTDEQVETADKHCYVLDY